MKYRTVTGGRLALTSLAAAALVAFGPSAWALGLGRLNVQSSLGEALRAEIEVTSLSADEASSLNVRVASSDAYLAAGVDYSAILTGTRVALSRRADGRPFIRVTSDRAVLEPFVDVILELTWASGRLVREYTLLLDPPRELAAPAAATAPVMSSAPTPAAPPQAVAAPAPSAPAAPAARAARAAAPVAAERAAVPAASAARPSAASDYTVKPGDNLSRIAGRMLPGGVALDQMLVALFRNNTEAFVGENMNRLKSGAVLKAPTAEEARQLSRGEAREFIQAQSADFGAYRQKLASGVPAATEAAARQATGKVEAAVEDRKQPATPTPDKLKLTQGAAKAASSAEAAIAKAAAEKQAASREAELARNVEELKKLQTASAKQATAQPTAPTAASTPAMPQVPVAPPLPAVAAASLPVPATAAPAPSAPTPTAAKASAKEETGLFGELLDNPMLLPGAGVLLLLLGGAAAMRMRRRMSKAGETSFLESRVQPDSFFGASGGQRIDTNETGRTSGPSSNPSSMSYSLSQLDAIGDVDPVAEADVYLAYGRDLQAEEILKEAMRSTPDRAAIRLKLLEVYAKRRDTKGFEALAVQFFKWQGASPEEWSRVQELGRSIDPENPLYSPGAEPDSGLPDDDGFIEPLGVTTQGPSSLPASPRLGLSRVPDLDGPTLATPARVGRDEPTTDQVTGPDENADIDIDLDTPSMQSLPGAVAPDATRPIPLNALAPAAAPASAGGFGADRAAAAPAQTDDADRADEAFRAVDLERPPAAAASADGMEFDLAADTSEPEPAAEPQPLEFDLGNLSLELDQPAEGAGPAAASRSGSDSSFVDFDLAEAPASTFNEGASALEKKLDLADEFRQIGDVEGARDLLAEVIAEAEEGALKLKAQQMLDDLA